MAHIKYVKGETMSSLEGPRSLEKPRIVGPDHCFLWACGLPCSLLHGSRVPMYLRPASMPWCPANQEGYSQGLTSALLSQASLEPDQLGPVGILLPD